MKQLHVALVIKNADAPKRRETRNMGYWSYPVPEFTWDHMWFGDTFHKSVDTLAGKGYDLVFHEDGGNWGEYVKGRIPVVYMDIDSTLDAEHYAVRRRQARQADMVLVDHDFLQRFMDVCPVVRRLNYCVNDRVFKPHPDSARTMDLTFHCSTGGPGGEERKVVRRFLDTWAKEWEHSYRSGVLGLEEYAHALGTCKIAVNQPRTPTNRPHRIFDAMAAGACVLTGTIPAVDGDGLRENVHFVRYQDLGELDAKLVKLFDSGDWRGIAEVGRAHVMGNHTWAIRAKQLRHLLHEELGL